MIFYAELTRSVSSGARSIVPAVPLYAACQSKLTPAQKEDLRQVVEDGPGQP